MLLGGRGLGGSYISDVYPKFLFYEILEKPCLIYWEFCDRQYNMVREQKVYMNDFRDRAVRMLNRNHSWRF